MKTRLIARLLLVLAVPVTSVSLAQTPPDAGALQQQIERERQQQLPRRIAPDKPATPAVLPPLAGIVVTVKEFRFAGNTLLSAEQLAPAVAPFLDRPLDYNQLQAAAAAVAETYRAAGWVVRAYLPQQDIKDGIVTLQIIEAVFGGVKLEGRAARVAGEQLLRNVSAQQAGGAPLNADALDRALLLADDLPGVTVAGSLAAGAAEGQTDLILKIADEPLLTGEAGLDNTGSRSTGSERFTASLNANSPFGLGDLLSSNLIHTRGSDYLRLAYTIPVGGDGWRLGVNASGLRYKLIVAPYNSSTDKGTSSTLGLEASYPLIRSRLANLYLNLAYDHKAFDNQFGGATTTRYTVDDSSVTLNGNLFDNWGGGGANSASLAWVEGRQDLGTLNISENAKLDGRFSKLRYSLSRQQVITDSLALFALLAGQEAGKALDSSEKFYLGGSGGVRAYPSSEGGGDSGVMSNLELRWKLPAGFLLTGFYDAGHIRNHDGSPSYGLKGAGAALAWQGDNGLNLKAVWARRIGTNPNPTASGNDQDGSLDKNRLWLSASLPF
jgi:hemolysin activation/secretion protein